MKKNFLIVIFMFLMSLGYAQTPLETAVDFNVKDLNGNKIQLFNLLDNNKIVVIKFYSTACTWCQLYSPDIQETYEKYGCNSGNVYVMTIEKEHNNTNVSGYYAMEHLTLPGASGMEGNGAQVFELYQISSTPTVIVIRPDRVIASQHVWPPEFANITAIVDELGGVEADCDIATTDVDVNLELKIIPNPVSSVMEIKSNKEFDAVEIYTIEGKRVLMNNNTNRLITVEHLQNGMYFARIMNDGKLIGKTPFIVNH